MYCMGHIQLAEASPPLPMTMLLLLTTSKASDQHMHMSSSPNSHHTFQYPVMSAAVRSMSYHPRCRSTWARPLPSSAISGVL